MTKSVATKPTEPEWEESTVEQTLVDQANGLGGLVWWRPTNELALEHPEKDRVLVRHG